MLPPHRPFRDKPAPSAVIKKKSALSRDSILELGIQATRKGLKADLVILNQSDESAS